MTVQATLRVRVLVAVLALAFSPIHAQAQTVTIDFETLPDGSIPYGSIADSYSSWGVTFFQEGNPQCPGFVRDAFGSDGFFAFCYVTTYPPGFNIILDFASPVGFVSADVMTAPGHSVLLKAISQDGQLLASSRSVDSQEFWKGRLEVSSQHGISRAEFWPSAPNASVGIDDLVYGEVSTVEVPTLGSWSLMLLSISLGFAAATMLRRRGWPT